MGEITLVLLGGLVVAGVLLIGLGMYTHARLPLAVGVAILLAVAGLWLFGLAGIALGVIAFAFLARRRPA